MCIICNNEMSFNKVFYKAFNPICNKCRLRINYDFELIKYADLFIHTIDIFTSLDKEVVNLFSFEIINILNIITNNISKTILIFDYYEQISFKDCSVIIFNINVNYCRNLKY